MDFERQRDISRFRVRLQLIVLCGNCGARTVRYNEMVGRFECCRCGKEYTLGELRTLANHWGLSHNHFTDEELNPTVGQTTLEGEKK